MKRPLRLLTIILIFTALIFMPYGRFGVADVKTSDGKKSNTQTRERIDRYVLDNGLTVITKQNNFSPTVALMVWVKIGSAAEEKGEYGLAHVHEHMLFKGTDKRGIGQIASEIEGAGGDINAFTSFDETVYYIVIPAKHLELGLDVLSDAIFSSSFEENELQKELNVVLEEIKRGKDDPTSVLSNALFETAYKVHPYRREIIGSEESVAAFTRKDVVNFYRKWYSPENMALVIAGDFDNEAIRKKIDLYFGVKKKAQGKTKVEENLHHAPEPKQTEPRFAILQGEVSQVYLDIAFHIPNINGEDVPALDVLNYILGSGESSRLYRRVQADKGLVFGIYTYTFTPRDPGVAMVGATLDPKNFRTALEEILKEIALLKVEGPGTEEISRAKSNIESESIYSRETVQGEARKFGYYEVIAGDIDFEENYLRAVEQITAEDIKRVAKKYFTSDNITVAAYLPESSKLQNVDDASLATLVKSALNPPPVAASDEGGVRKIVLANGFTVLIKERHDIPLVAYRLAMLGGVRLEPQNQRGISNFISRTISKGTPNRNAEEIAAEVEDLSGGVSGFSGRDSIGVQAEFISKNFSRGFDIFADISMNPLFPSKEMEQQRREIISALERMQDKPDALTLDLFRMTLFDTHPYATRVLGEHETVGKMKQSDLMEYYRNLLVPQNMVLSIVGDVSADEMLPRIARTFGTIPKRVSAISSPPEAKFPTKIKTAKIIQPKEQAQIVLGFMGPSLKSEDRYAMDVLSTVLGGQGGRLFIELRDKKHLAYSVYAVAIESLDAGMFYTYIGTRPDNRDEAIKGLLAEIEKIVANPISEDELNRAREYLAGSYEIGLQTVGSQAMNLALNEVYGVGWRESMEYPSRIRAVTIDDVFRVAKKYLRTDRYVLAELSPEKTEPAANR